MTLASLFDGAGGFPLAGLMNGITPVWASEIEPFPIRVTTKRLPDMVHYGDVSLIDGSKVAPVDIITFGSPCTDLSVAGKREGIQAERSGLFFDACRIIKEMRVATNGVYPRFIIWENVPGAYSSGKGEDFRAVLETICQIADSTISIPRPADGKWFNAGNIMGKGFSVAWRTLDAKYFGVAQRRRRIFLVADFSGECAGEVLFEQVGVSRDFKTGKEQGKGTAGTVEGGIGTASEPLIIENHPGDSRVDFETDGCFQTLSERMGTGGGNFNQGKNAQYKPAIEEEMQPTLTAKGAGGCYQETTGALTPGAHPGGFNGQDAHNDMLITSNSIVRRLLPIECARLQGFPDWWTSDLTEENPDIDFWLDVWKTYARITGGHIKSRKQVERWLNNPYSDSAEYKMWGNGVALPCVSYVLAGITNLRSVKNGL